MANLCELRGSNRVLNCNGSILGLLTCAEWFAACEKRLTINLYTDLEGLFPAASPLTEREYGYLARSSESSNKLKKNRGKEAILGRLSSSSPTESFLDVAMCLLDSKPLRTGKLSSFLISCSSAEIELTLPPATLRLLPALACEALAIQESFCRRLHREFTLDMMVMEIAQNILQKHQHDTHVL
ncbi:hypothetical protein SDJN02_00172, partial [Cucurbita argyrosperma subsp. argyrosperma]